MPNQGGMNQCGACGRIASPEEPPFETVEARWCIWVDSYWTKGIPERATHTSRMLLCGHCAAAARRRVLHLTGAYGAPRGGHPYTAGA